MRTTGRQLLLDIGMSQVNATQTIPYLMISPATIDPKAPLSIMLVQCVQHTLNEMGAHDVALTGYLDQATAAALSSVVGENWQRMTWGANLDELTRARSQGFRFKAPDPSVSGMPVAVSGPLDFLPDVPGGIVTYGIAAYLLYRYLRRSS